MSRINPSGRIADINKGIDNTQGRMVEYQRQKLGNGNSSSASSRHELFKYTALLGYQKQRLLAWLQESITEQEQRAREMKDPYLGVSELASA